MKENTDEKSLIKINENSIFYKIKQFFKGLFYKKEPIDKFMEEIKKIEDGETLLLKIQKKYRSGEIKEEELSDEQVNSLCALYDKQIANLKKSNEIRKQRLLEYRRKMQTDN